MISRCSSSEKNLAIGESSAPSLTRKNASPFAPYWPTKAVSSSIVLRLNFSAAPLAFSPRPRPAGRCGAGRFEGVEVALRRQVADVDQLHPIAEVGLVAAETLHHVVVGIA